MLCAHWDSRPRAENDPDSVKGRLPIIGANDGASGVAVLLEIARCLKEKSPAIGVDIVLFDGEDWGISGREDGWFLGSKYFAANLGAYRPRLAILLDMVGDADLKIPREAISQQYAGHINDFIWKIARENNSTVFVDSVGKGILDDHVPLLSRGIRAINIIDFNYPYWHTQQDTPDKCAPASLAAVGNVLWAALQSKEIEKF